MGNNPVVTKRRPSDDDEAYLKCHSTDGGTKMYQMKRKFIEKPVQESKCDETVTKVVKDKSMDDVINGMSSLAMDCQSVCYGKSKSSEITSSPPQTPKTLPTVFKWEGGGKEVYVSGTFNNWRSKIPMVRSSENFYTIIDLPEGEQQYKFIVDGQWKVDTSQPIARHADGFSKVNNIIYVKSTDFDVLKALSQDMANSKPQSNHEHVSSATMHQEQAWEYGECLENVKYSGDPQKPSNFSYSPPGSYSSVIPEKVVPQDLGSMKDTSPPLLPPQLLQIILNKDTSSHCDPNLLPNPNHVMVNHMYALSIKDGVIVLSAITRYRKKHVSTVIYKPI